MTTLIRPVVIKTTGANDVRCDDHCPMRDRSECRVDGAKLKLDSASETYCRSAACLREARASIKEEA